MAPLGALGVMGPVGLLASATLGAVAGAVTVPLDLNAQRHDYPHYGESVEGQLKTANGSDGQKHLAFYPNNQPPVDLKQFACSPVAGGGEPGSIHCEAQWWQSAYHNVLPKD